MAKHNRVSIPITPIYCGYSVQLLVLLAIPFDKNATCAYRLIQVPVNARRVLAPGYPDDQPIPMALEIHDVCPNVPHYRVPLDWLKTGRTHTDVHGWEQTRYTAVQLITGLSALWPDGGNLETEVVQL